MYVSYPCSFSLEVDAESDAKRHLVRSTGTNGDGPFAPQERPVVEVGLESTRHKWVGQNFRGAVVDRGHGVCDARPAYRATGRCCGCGSPARRAEPPPTRAG